MEVRCHGRNSRWLGWGEPGLPTLPAFRRTERLIELDRTFLLKGSMEPAKPAVEHKAKRQEQAADATPPFTCLGETQLSSDVKECLGAGTFRNAPPAHGGATERRPSARPSVRPSVRWLDCCSARKALASGQQLCITRWDDHKLPAYKGRTDGGRQRKER